MERYSRHSDGISNLDSHLVASGTSINFSDNKDTFHSVNLLRLVRPHDENDRVPSGIRIGNVGARATFFHA